MRKNNRTIKNPNFYLIWVIATIIIFFNSCTSKTRSDEVGYFNTTTTPSLLAASLTSIPFPNKTPFPANTLTALGREDFVRETLLGNSNCQLPCWWGITPGKTTWKETKELLYYLGSGIAEFPGYSPNSVFYGAGGFDFEGISIKTGVGFEETDGFVKAILIDSDGYNKPDEFQFLWQNYSLKEILKRYGIPDRVLLNVTEVYNLGRGYHLWVFYDKLGFMIRYSGGVLDAPALTVCPAIKSMVDINLNLQDPKSLLPLERFDAILEDIRLQTETGKTRGLHTIQEAAGMNEKEFYDLFMQEEELICFDTPASIWDVKQ